MRRRGNGSCCACEADDCNGQRLVFGGIFASGGVRSCHCGGHRGIWTLKSTGTSRRKSGEQGGGRYHRARRALSRATGDTFTGAQAAEFGLVNGAVPLRNLRTNRAH